MATSPDPNWKFQPLTDDDLPLLHGWLNEPGVVRFWEGDDVTWPGVVSDYGSPELRATLRDEYPDFPYDAEGSDFDWANVERYVAMANGNPVGWIQCYAVDAFDDEDEVQAWLKLGFDKTGVGIDYLIGDPASRGKGLGSSMIRSFIADVVFGRHPEWTQVGASPERANDASCRALVKAGLSLVGSFDAADLYAMPR